MRELKCRYFWKEKWYYIDFYKNNLAIKFNEFETRAKTSEFYFWTGLKDKNGKDIYEGDILEDDVGDILEVKFGKLPLDKSGDCVCTFQAFYCYNYGQLGQAPSHECQNIGDWMEVIGNVFENPELLKERV